MNEKHMQDMKNHDNDVKSGKAKEIFKVMKKGKKDVGGILRLSAKIEGVCFSDFTVNK